MVGEVTAEPSVRDRAAEVLLAHIFRTAGSQDAYLGVCSHMLNAAEYASAPMYAFEDHLAHQADALAAAGLLAGWSQVALPR